MTPQAIMRFKILTLAVPQFQAVEAQAKHQEDLRRLITALEMDFLRTFLTLLPLKTQQQEAQQIFAQAP